ncbi:unnamed protein product, partial [Hymenolepis diminuta]
MISLKIWPLVLAIYSFLISKDNILLSASYIPNGIRRNLNTIVGGYVGCLYSDVCLTSETCQDDELFGRCVDVHYEGRSYILASEERNFLRNLRRVFHRFGLDFDNKYAQCVLRGLILKFRLRDKYMKIADLCGDTPLEATDLL